MAITTKQREKILLLLMPCVLVVIVYSLFFNWAQQGKRKELLKKVSKIGDNQKAVQDLLQTTNRKNVTVRQTTALNQRIGRITNEIAELCDSIGGTNRRFEMVEQMTKLLSENNISLVSQKVIAVPTIPQRIEASLKNIEKSNGGKRIEYREFSLQGTYPNMVLFFEQLSKQVNGAFPVSFKLNAENPKERDPTWVLIVAM